MEKLRELERRIDEVLFYIWDPIGVSDIPAARAEYSSYTMTILKHVLNEDLNSITSQLGEIESITMGLTKNEPKNLKVAELLVEFKYATDEGLK